MKKNGTTAVLLLRCPDQRGLVATVSDFIYRRNGNIIHADQHTDRENGIFFQRVEWEINGFAIPRDRIAPAFAPIAEQFGMEWDLRFTDVRPRVALMVSRESHCMFDLLVRHRIGDLAADIPLVISNHPELSEVTRSFDVEFHCLPVTAETKAQQEAQALSLLQQHRIDVVVLARYMQVLSNDFVRCYPNRIINIHHSFLPAFAGARPYHQAYQRGVKIIGATAHYVTADLDEGPIIEQDVVRISHRDTVNDLIQKGRDLEKIVLARAVALHCQNRVIAYDRKTVIFN